MEVKVVFESLQKCWTIYLAGNKNLIRFYSMYFTSVAFGCAKGVRDFRQTEEKLGDVHNWNHANSKIHPARMQNFDRVARKVFIHPCRVTPLSDDPFCKEKVPFIPFYSPLTYSFDVLFLCWTNCLSDWKVERN